MSFARRLQNRSYASARAEPTIDRHGADVLCVVAKLALSFDRSGSLGLSARPVRLSDVPDGEGGIRYPSDIAAEKVGTDVGVVGTLVPSEREPARRVHTWVRVGRVGKAALVVGPRRFTATGDGVVPGEPEPLVATPLVHGLAWGGADESASPASIERFNPVGRGHAIDPRSLVGLPAPQIEPTSLDPTERGAPASPAARAQAAYAPIPASWAPRADRGGTEDDRWRRTRAPVVPEDWDPRAESWAADGLHAEGGLAGTETVELGGFRPGPRVLLELPGFVPTVHGVIGGERREHAARLDGLLVDLDAGIVELVWRAAIPLPAAWARLERIEVSTARPLPAAIAARPRMTGSP